MPVWRIQSTNGRLPNPISILLRVRRSTCETRAVGSRKIEDVQTPKDYTWTDVVRVVTGTHLKSTHPGLIFRDTPISCCHLQRYSWIMTRINRVSFPPDLWNYIESARSSTGSVTLFSFANDEDVRQKVVHGILESCSWPSQDLPIWDGIHKWQWWGWQHLRIVPGNQPCCPLSSGERIRTWIM
jgi:hypothetical protein